MIKAVVPAELIDEETKYFINPTGRFVIGGPQGDAGLTGRKIIVDTYGGYARHGGGAFSGKDATKVDRSAAYAARYVAKNIVAAGLADKAEVQLAYAIGVAQPVSIAVDTFGTGKVSEEVLVELVRNNFDLRPAGIIKMLDLTSSNLQTNSCLRTLRTYRCRSSMGTYRQSSYFKRASWSIIYEKEALRVSQSFFYLVLSRINGQ